MFAYSIKKSFITPYDPYWMCRLLSFKAGTASILLFIWNAFFFSSGSFEIYFMTVLIGTLFTEMLPAYNKNAQLIALWKITLLLAMCLIIFSLFSYFNFLQLIAVTTLIYFIFKLLMTGPSTVALPATMVVFGMVGIESGITDMNDIANKLVNFIEFLFVASFLVYFFPNFRDLTYKSALMRLLESDSNSISTLNFTNNNPEILNHLSFLKKQIPYLDKPYENFYADMVSFQMSIGKHKVFDLKSSLLASSLLLELSANVAEGKTFNVESQNLQYVRNTDDGFYSCFINLSESWNKLCKA